MHTFRVAAILNGIVSCGVLLSACALGGNFAQDFQSARKLYYSGKAAEAEEAFVALAEQKVSQRATDESLAQAAACALAQKKYDRAVQYAGKIADPPLNKFCRINIFRHRSQWDEILALCKGEDIETWPDALIYDALLWRGRAYAVKQDCPNAEKDFISAVRHTVLADNKAFAYQFLGDLYRDISKDEQKALDAYGEAVKLGGSIPVRRLAAAAIARARLLAAHGKGAEALAEMDRLKADQMKDPYWRCAIQMCHAEILEGLGRTADALARYKIVVSYDNAPDVFLGAAKKKIEAIEKKR
jgi:tetratricopeptide (TPR) repeat protein